MRKINYLLILLAFLAAAPVFAEEPKQKEENLDRYKKYSPDYSERLERLKDHMNRLQTVPIINNKSIELQLGPAQFQMTIPFK